MTKRGATRRRFLRGTGVVALSGFLSVFSESARAQSDEAWPQFRYDDTNTGYAAENTGPVRNVEQRWVVETGDEVWSSPSVVGGTVYVGSFDGSVYALDAADGTEQWAFETGEPIASSPVVADGTVYIGSNDNTVYALDAADGAEQWTFETGGSVQSSPAVVDGTVYIGSWDSNVYALDAVDGTEQWAFEIEGGADISSSAAVMDGTVYVGGGGSGNVYALDAGDGVEQWRWETGTVYSSPAVVNDTVFIGSYDGTVYALDASVGPDAELNPFRERWNIETNDEVWSSPAVVDGTVYVGSKDNGIYAFTGVTSTPTATETAAEAADDPNEPQQLRSPSQPVNQQLEGRLRSMPVVRPIPTGQSPATSGKLQSMPTAAVVGSLIRDQPRKPPSRQTPRAPGLN